ncbi:hypothetical protein LI287_09595 [Enterobacter roggenkampii]|nr:polymorphic toxin type 46 domain-containing protein [Enterobacter roggenkampii]MCB7502971.1 hypothetical protein [Enterobacter roggenkampii]
MFAGKKSAQIREILISESAWEEMTCLFAPSLGINPEGQVRDTGLIVPKEVKAYQAQQKVEMLRSSATPALDTWSVPDKPFQTEGGGIQWFTTKRDIWTPYNE